MALSNLNNFHLATSEVTEVNHLLTNLEDTLAGIKTTLTADDRQKYGSINEQNKLFVNKVYDYHKNVPNLRTMQVDWAEFENDYNSRANLEGIINRLESLLVKLKNAKTLHDYDNFQAALVDYAYTNFMVGTGAEGFETKRNELKQFFTRSKVKNTPPTE